MKQKRVDSEMNSKKTLNEEIARLVEDPEAYARFYFDELPALFQAKHDLAMTELNNKVDAIVQDVKKERLEHEQDAEVNLSRHLAELEIILRKWLTENHPQKGHEYSSATKALCHKIDEELRMAWQKDSHARELENKQKDIVADISGHVKEATWSFADDIYSEIAKQVCNKTHATLRNFFDVEMQDGEISAPPVVHASPAAAWIGDNLVSPSGNKDSDDISCVGPSDFDLFSIPIFLRYGIPGWLTFESSQDPHNEASCEDKTATILSNFLFQRLLSGLPNIKIAIFDPGRSNVKGYEHDLSKDLPTDPETHEKPVEKYHDFFDFKTCLEKWLEEQPEDYEMSRKTGVGNKRLFRISAILVLPDDADEREVATYRDWISWWIRQSSRGIELFAISTESIFDSVRSPGLVDSLYHLRLDHNGTYIHEAEGKSWTIDRTSLNPSWAATSEGWAMGRQVLQKLIRPPRKEEPGVISVRFADEDNGEAFPLQYTSQKANTVFIHGKQGSGKSVALLSFILRAAKKYSPEELTFYVFDFKNTFALLRNLKHVECLTLSTNEQIMLGVLRDLEARRQERQECFRMVENKYRRPCRDLDDYNRFRVENPDDKLPALPRILVVVDECKNMLLAKLREIGELLENELLSKCRAAGIHFLFATTEDIRTEVGRSKFDATLELSQPTPGRFIATLAEGEIERTLIMPVIEKEEIENELKAIDEINQKHARSGRVRQPLFFDEDKERGIDVANYVTFAEELRQLADITAGEVFRSASGIDTLNLRQLLVVPFRRGRRGQGLSIFGRWNSPCFRGGMELFLRTLELAARRGMVRADVLDLGKRWAGETDGCDGRFNVWRDTKDFLDVKREWIKTADGQGDIPRVLVAFDAEDTLQGEIERARRNAKRGATCDAPVQSLADLDAMLAAIGGDSREDADASSNLPPDEVDRLFQNATFLKAASEQGAFLVVVTEKPIEFRDSVVSPESFGRFLVYATAREFPGLDNAPADNMGYYVESPGEPPQYFLPFAQDDISKAIEKAAKPQKGPQAP